MHVAARPRIPGSAALTFARWTESVPGRDRWPRGARGGDDHGRKAAGGTRQRFECEYQPKPENEVWGAIRLAAIRGRVRLLLWVRRGRTFCRRIAFVAGPLPRADEFSVGRVETSWLALGTSGLRNRRRISPERHLGSAAGPAQATRLQRSTGSVTGTRMCSLAPLKSKQSGNARAHHARRSPV
jgi:hypothetical protein